MARGRNVGFQPVEVAPLDQPVHDRIGSDHHRSGLVNNFVKGVEASDRLVQKALEALVFLRQETSQIHFRSSFGMVSQCDQFGQSLPEQDVGQEIWRKPIMSGDGG